jgi:hypothetical protein
MASLGGSGNLTKLESLMSISIRSSGFRDMAKIRNLKMLRILVIYRTISFAYVKSTFFISHHMASVSSDLQ